MTSPIRLTSEQVKSALTEFSALQSILISELAEEDLDAISAWQSGVMRLNPTVALRPDSLARLTADIFEDDRISEYVLGLTFRFFTLVDASPDFIERLCNNLSDGLCIDGPVVNRSILPDSIRLSAAMTLLPATGMSRWSLKVLRFFGITEEVTVAEFLQSNKFLITVFLTHLTNTTAV